jgi:RNA polymerase sigma-70 factor, ECF subfamily
MQRYRPLVRKMCAALLADAAEAEDATQQTFLLAYESLLSGVQPQRPQAWLCSIARHECWARQRRRRRREQAVPREAVRGDLDPADRVMLHTELAALIVELDRLPSRQREALLLHELAGLSQRQLADRLESSESAVEALLARARRTLRRRRSTLVLLPVPLRSIEGRIRSACCQAHAWASITVQTLSGTAATTLMPLAAAATIAVVASPVDRPRPGRKSAAVEITQVGALTPPVGQRHSRLAKRQIRDTASAVPAPTLTRPDRRSEVSRRLPRSAASIDTRAPQPLPSPPAPENTDTDQTRRNPGTATGPRAVPNAAEAHPQSDSQTPITPPNQLERADTLFETVDPGAKTTPSPGTTETDPIEDTTTGPAPDTSARPTPENSTVQAESTSGAGGGQSPGATPSPPTAARTDPSEDTTTDPAPDTSARPTPENSTVQAESTSGAHGRPGTYGTVDGVTPGADPSPPASSNQPNTSQRDKSLDSVDTHPHPRRPRPTEPASSIPPG